ncbi:Bromodomain-containing protein, partial [Rhizoclosmatium globosum]
DQKNCTNLIKIVKKHPSAWPFLVPVDPVKAGAPTYFDVVKNPWILEPLKSAFPYYTSVKAFMSDLQLVFDNCYLFNSPDHAVSLAARQVEK